MLSRLIPLIVLAAPAFAQHKGCLIQADAVGPVRGGMTVAQARAALHGAVLKPTEDADRLPMLTVVQQGLHTMDLYIDPRESVRDNAKISRIRVYDGACSTADGVRPGMGIGSVAQHYGRVTRVMEMDTESREFADFERQPTWMQIQVGNGQTGIYSPGKRCTTNYNSSAHIASLWVSRPAPNKTAEDEALCNIPKR